MSVNPLPTLFPLAIDPLRRVQLLTLSEADYRAASFLDGRLLADCGPSAWIDWPAFESMAAGLVERRHFIFHVGHAGSTLVSRLLGEHVGLFALREPALLRTLPGVDGLQSPPDQPADGDLTDVVLRLLSRTWRSEQTALIKATSFVSEIASALLARTPAGRAILVFANPLAYLRGVLGGPASRMESSALGPSRLARLHRRLGAPVWRIEALSEGERVAMSWLSEMAALHAAAMRHPDRVLWINFDQLLADPAAGLRHAFAGLQVHASEDEVRTILDGPIMRRYSKALEHAYDRELRARVLIQAEAEHGVEIRRGMDWLGRAAGVFPAVREVIEAAARVKLQPPAASAASVGT